MEKQSVGERLFGAIVVFYCSSSIYMVVYGFLYYRDPLLLEPLARSLLREASQITDPVLRVICKAIIVVVALLYLPGVLGSMLGIIAVLLAWMILSFVYKQLMILAGVSQTGAIIAGLVFLGAAILILCILWQVLKPVALWIWRVVRWVATPIYGLVFDWWLKPMISHRKGRLLMDTVSEKKAQYEASLARLQAECPEIADIPLSVGATNWMSQVAERFRDRQTGKTMAQKILLLEQTKRFFAEYRAALDAQDEFKRYHHTVAEKDDEAELRRLERLKRKLQLEREIADLSGSKNVQFERQFNESKKKRLVDIQNEVFLEFERHVEKNITLRAKYNELARKIENHPDLDADQKSEMLKKLKEELLSRESQRTAGSARSIPIYKKEA